MKIWSREFPSEWRGILRIVWAKTICFISDVFYVFVVGDRSTMYKHLKDNGIKPSWRAYARNPIVGIFGKLL